MAMNEKGKGHWASPGNAQFQQETAPYSHIPEEREEQKHLFMTLIVLIKDISLGNCNESSA